MPQAAPVYFSSLQLTNVRCFGASQTLRLTTRGRPAQWNLIIGENGTGKTTLLECLTWMRPVLDIEEDLQATDYPRRSLSLQQSQLKPALEDEDNATIETLSRNWSTRARLHSHLKGGFNGSLHVEPTLKAQQRTEELRLAVHLTFDENAALRRWRTKGTPLESLSTFNDPLIVAYGANRYLGYRNLVTDSQLEAFDHKRLSQGTELYDIEELLMRLDYAASVNPRGPELRHLDQLRKVIATILFDDHDDRRIQIYPPDVLETGRPSGVYARTFTGLVPISALGLGYRTTAGWVMDLAWRILNWYPDSPNPLTEPVVVLVDEIDLHLHPRWQLGIMRDLTVLFPGTQFIATSHSPLIVQAAEAANLVLLRKQHDGVEIVNNPRVSRQHRVDQILSSLLFEVPHTRPRQVQELLEERARLLDKEERSPREERQLRRLQNLIGDLPTAEDPEDQAAMALVRRFAAYLENRER